MASLHSQSRRRVIFPAWKPAPCLRNRRWGGNGLPCGPVASRRTGRSRAFCGVAVHAPCHAGGSRGGDLRPAQFRGKALCPRHAAGTGSSPRSREQTSPARVEGNPSRGRGPGQGAHRGGKRTCNGPLLSLFLSQRSSSAPAPAAPVTLPRGSGNGCRAACFASATPHIGPVTELYVGPEPLVPASFGFMSWHARPPPAVRASSLSRPSRSGPRTLTVRDIRLRLGPCDGTSEIILLKKPARRPEDRRQMTLPGVPMGFLRSLLTAAALVTMPLPVLAETATLRSPSGLTVSGAIIAYDWRILPHRHGQRRGDNRRCGAGL